MKSLSLVWKLILAFLLVAITAAALVAVGIRLTSVDRLARLIVEQQRDSLTTSLAAYYGEMGSWEGVPQVWMQMQFAPGPGEAVGPGPEAYVPETYAPPMGKFFGGAQERDRRGLFALADAQGRVIVPSPDFQQGEQLSQHQLQKGEAILVDDEQVGTLLTANLRPRLTPAESLFLQRTNTALVVAALGAMVVALLVGVILARNLIRPLRALTLAAGNIARGQLEQQVPVTSRDELGRLAQAFNQMSQDVARSNQLRKQMTADIAHDLRTPLTVIGGYVESMRDGVLRPTPQRLAVIYTEIERLQNLVNDLKLLSLADAGELPLHPQPVNPRGLLEAAAAPFQHRASQQQVALRVDAPEGLPAVQVDEARMMQVFGNLLTNALRYTPAGGAVRLTAAVGAESHTAPGVDGKVRLTVQDTGTGIPEEELPLIFNRFHRVDPSRHSDDGESGLGLAIVRALVEAHGGRVWAESHPGEGASIIVEIPAGEDRSGDAAPQQRTVGLKSSLSTWKSEAD